MNMDDKIPTEDEITKLLSKIQPQPEPGFRQKMAGQPWNHQGRMVLWTGFTPRRTMATIGLVLLVVVGVSLLSPSVNTLAQRFTQFFSPSSRSQVIPEISPLEPNPILERFNLTITEAEILAGFEMKTPRDISQEFNLRGAAYDQLREAIILHYTTESGGLVLRISQQKIDSDYQGIGPEAEVEIISVGPYTGEFVAGGWKITEVESEADATQSPDTPQTVWNAKVNLQTLRWTDGEFLFEIILAGGLNQTGYLDKDDLIALANRMH